MKSLHFFCLLLIGLVTVGCLETQLTTFEDESTGIKMNYPASWHRIQFDYQTIIANDEVLLNQEPFDSGARLILFSFPKGTLNFAETDSLLDVTVQSLQRNFGGEVYKPREEFEVDSYRAIAETRQGLNENGVEIIYQTTLIEGESATILALAEVDIDSENELVELENIMRGVEFLEILQ